MTSAAEDRALFNRIAQTYARKDVAPSSAYVRQAQLLLALRPLLQSLPSLGTVLEIGCGIAAPAQHLAPFYQRYVGVDQAETMIALARKLHAHNPKAEFVVGDAASVDLSGLQARVVLAIGALHHMEDVPAVLQNVSRFVEPGAWFVSLEPQAGNPIIGLLRFFRARLDSSYSAKQRFFAPGELETLLARQGLESLQAEPEGFFSTPFAQVVMPGQWWALPAARWAWAWDAFLRRWLPRKLRVLSWNVIVRGRWPQ